MSPSRFRLPRVAALGPSCPEKSDSSVSDTAGKALNSVDSANREQ